MVSPTFIHCMFLPHQNPTTYGEGAQSVLTPDVLGLFLFYFLIQKPSTYVFPGGVIDKADFSNDWMELFKQSFAKLGKDFTSLVNIQGPRPPLLKKSAPTDIPNEVALRICAIRETFEESGVLLLKSFSDELQNNLNADDIQGWRKEVYADATKFITMCR